MQCQGSHARGRVQYARRIRIIAIIVGGGGFFARRRLRQPHAENTIGKLQAKMLCFWLGSPDPGSWNDDKGVNYGTP